LIRFSSTDGLVSWNDTLIALDQEFNSFVPSEAFVVGLDAHDWVDQAVGDPVAGWFITTPDGGSRYVPFPEDETAAEAAKHSVAVPRVRCSDNVTVRAVGGRRYEERPLRIQGGKLRLGHPAATGHRMAFGTSVALGMQWHAGVNGIRGGDHHEPSGYPSALVGAWAQYRPRVRMSFELSGDFWYANRFVYTPNESYQLHAYYRIPLFLTTGFYLTDRIQFGVGVGYAPGDTMLEREHDEFGGADGSWALQLVGRFKPFIALALEARLIVLPNETVHSFETDFRGQVLTQTGNFSSAMLTVGVRWDMASGTILAVPEEPSTATVAAAKHKPATQQGRP
jgi:hypothetical protein